MINGIRTARKTAMQRRQVLTLPALALAQSACSTQPANTQPANTQVLTEVQTTLGSFVVAVDTRKAPLTVANYLAYVDAKHLDNGQVYRIVNPANQSAQTQHKIEVVQWGMNTPDDKPAPFPPIAHETTQQTGLLHLDGTVSMARNGPGTATAEYFICIGAQPELDFGGRRNPDGQGFAAFGQVVSGRAVLQAIYAQGQVETQYIQPPLAVLRVRRLNP
jgi:peptidyl-prolyl cis-trans isomerase A (cyclophilin A)